MSDVVVKEAITEAPEVMRGKILALEEAILKQPQIEIPILHYFAPGLYLREMRMPAHAIITGKIHKTEHYCILAQGSVTLVTENGREQVSAPAIIHSKPGAKRAIHSHTDVTWVNVHHNPADERDLDKIDDIFVTDTYEKYLSFQEAKQIQGGK